MSPMLQVPKKMLKGLRRVNNMLNVMTGLPAEDEITSIFLKSLVVENFSKSHLFLFHVSLHLWLTRGSLSKYFNNTVILRLGRKAM